MLYCSALKEGGSPLPAIFNKNITNITNALTSINLKFNNVFGIAEELHENSTTFDLIDSFLGIAHIRSTQVTFLNEKISSKFIAAIEHKKTGFYVCLGVESVILKDSDIVKTTLFSYCYDENNLLFNVPAIMQKSLFKKSLLHHAFKLNNLLSP